MVREAWNEREKSVRGRQGWSEHAAQRGYRRLGGASWRKATGKDLMQYRATRRNY